MKKWARRGAAWALALAILLSPPAARAVLSDVYFTAVNDQLLELSDETMPFFSGGVLYVSSRLFEGTDLGVSYVRDTNSGLAMLYTTNTKVDLRFDLEEQVAYDRQGNFYSGRAIERNGVIFFPLDLVCKRFGLNHTYNLTDTVPLIRVTSASAILDDSFFIDAASTQMADRYAEYERAVTAVPDQGGTTAPPEQKPGPTVPQPPHTPETPVHAAEGQKVYLLFSCRAEEARSVMERLGDVQATFLLTAEEMEDADLLRGLVAQGHARRRPPGSWSEPGSCCGRPRAAGWSWSGMRTERTWGRCWRRRGAPGSPGPWTSAAAAWTPPLRPAAFCGPSGATGRT